MGYFRHALISVSWVSAFRITNRILSVIRTALLARLLTPTQFGDFGISAMVLAFAEIFTETGINVFLVQQEDEASIHHYLNTAWVISIIRGFFIATLVILISLPVSHFFQNDASRSLILLIALVPLIRGFINPATVKFQKHLKFNQEFYFRTLISLADAAVALTIAFVYKSPIGLIWGLIAGAVVEVIASLILVHPTPKFVVNKQQVKDILQSGKWVTGAGIAAYFAGKGPDISIGKLLSTQSLGVFQMAYKFSVMFVDELIEMVNRVAFPVYTRIQGDRARLKKAFLRTYFSFISSVSILMLLVALCAQPIVTIVLGPGWIDTTVYLRLLCMVGVAIAFAAPTNPLFLAVKKQNYLTHVVIAQLFVFIIMIIPIISRPSLEHIILALLASIIASIPLRTYYAYKILVPTP